MIQIYHNSRCGKSRDCLVFLQNTNQNFEIINYLTDTPNFEELQNIIHKLGIKPIELIRTKEKIWVDNFKNKTLTDDALIEIMTQNPILIERPIVIKNDKAIIVRPLDKIKNFI